MYALFLESYAARQVDEYCRRKGLNADEVKKSLYRNGFEYKCFAYARRDRLIKAPLYVAEEYDNYWVTKCFAEDSHKHVDVDQMCCWEDTPEGGDFWRTINNVELRNE